jgi:hypothetical protein
VAAILGDLGNQDAARMRLTRKLDDGPARLCPFF